MLFAAMACLLAAILSVGWWFLVPPDLRSLNAADVQRVEIWFEPWGEDISLRLVAQSSDPEAIAALLQAVQSSEETGDHKCGSRGIIHLQTSRARPVRLRFLPGHHAANYEYRWGGKVYRVPRAGFVEAMRQLGVEVPLECQ
jgi:hypothetical protein